MKRLPILVYAAAAAVCFAQDSRLDPIVWVAVAVVALLALVWPDSAPARLLAPVTIGLASVASAGLAVVVIALVIVGLAITVVADRPDWRPSMLSGVALAALGTVLALTVVGDDRLPPLDPPDEPSGVDPELIEIALDADRDLAVSAGTDATDIVRNDILATAPTEVAIDVRPDYDALTTAPIQAAIVAEGELALSDSFGGGGFGKSPLDPERTRFVPAPWWLAILLLVAGLIGLRAINRARVITLAGPATEDQIPDAIAHYDRIVAARGHPRPPNEPVLTHSRRVAAQTGDERLATLGRIVSDHTYSGRPLDPRVLDDMTR